MLADTGGQDWLFSLYLCQSRVLVASYCGLAPDTESASLIKVNPAKSHEELRSGGVESSVFV